MTTFWQSNNVAARFLSPLPFTSLNFNPIYSRMDSACECGEWLIWWCVLVLLLLSLDICEQWRWMAKYWDLLLNQCQNVFSATTWINANTLLIHVVIHWCVDCICIEWNGMSCGETCGYCCWLLWVENWDLSIESEREYNRKKCAKGEELKRVDIVITRRRHRDTGSWLIFTLHSWLYFLRAIWQIYI